MSRSQKPTPSTRPYRSVASQMTFDHHVAVEEAAAAAALWMIDAGSSDLAG